MVMDGNITEEDIEYYDVRSENVGLVITGGTIVHPSTGLRHRVLLEGWRESNQEMMKRRCDAVHARGARIIGQILHLGRELIGGESDYAPSAPSAIRSPRDPYPPHELDEMQIAAIIGAFTDTAANLLAAGYDGIELHAAHGYLLAQFLSPATNARTDRWGGSIENRFRFVREVVESMRARCGTEFALGVRLSGDEEIAGGLGLRDTVGIGQSLCQLGQVDYLNITMGTRGAYVKDATAPEATAAAIGRTIRSETGLPVVLSQKILGPELAESLLQQGAADIVGMARAFIADPKWAPKAAEGRASRIRPCVGLNQDCRYHAPHLHCAVNAEAGRETQSGFGPIGPAPQNRKIAVVGGGPGGMETARVAALRGHSVTLFEATESLGGQFLLAASLPHRQQLTRIVDHLASEIRHANVTLQLGVRIDEVAELTDRFEAVVLATGAGPCDSPPAESTNLPTLSWWEVLTQGAPPAIGTGRSVFLDDGSGFWFSYGVAEILAQAGWQVTFVTPSPSIGVGIPHESISPLFVRLGRSGTVYRVLADVTGVTEGAVILTNLASGADEVVECDLLVRQTGRRAVTLDATSLPKDFLFFSVGDCITPRRISHAILEGYKAARAL